MFRGVMIVQKNLVLITTRFLQTLKKYFYCFGFNYNESSIKYFTNRLKLSN